MQKFFEATGENRVQPSQTRCVSWVSTAMMYP